MVIDRTPGLISCVGRAPDFQAGSGEGGRLRSCIRHTFSFLVYFKSTRWTGECGEMLETDDQYIQLMPGTSDFQAGGHRYESCTGHTFSSFYFKGNKVNWLTYGKVTNSWYMFSWCLAPKTYKIVLFTSLLALKRTVGLGSVATVWQNCRPD